MQSNGFFPILQSFSAGNFKNRPTFSPRGMFLLLKSIVCRLFKIGIMRSSGKTSIFARRIILMAIV